MIAPNPDGRKWGKNASTWIQSAKTTRWLLKLQTHKHPILPILDSCTFHFICFFPNSFSYGVFANIGSGAASGGQVPGGSGKVPGQVPNHAFREGSGAGSERQVPGRLRGRFRTTGSGAASEPRSERVPGSSGVPGQVLNDRFRGRFRTRFRTTGFGAGFGGQGSAGTVPERFWPGF